LETKTWLKKSRNRNLVDEVTFSRITNMLSRCHLMLNKYIKSIGTSGTSSDQVREPDTLYGDVQETNDLPF